MGGNPRSISFVVMECGEEVSSVSSSLVAQITSTSSFCVVSSLSGLSFNVDSEEKFSQHLPQSNGCDLRLFVVTREVLEGRAFIIA